MYQLKSLDDTIAAISTAIGQGGIGIIRLSGQQSLPIADKIFKSKNDQKPSGFKNFTVHYGWIVNEVNNDEIVDEVLLTVMRAPKSYTKEDCVEISCHGSIVALKTILNLIIDAGARLAEPGEFTKRAFLNGRIDLTQAEAILDIIQAKTDAFLKVSTHQLKGELSVELEENRERLMKVYLEIEAIVNFPEDEIDVKGREQIAENISAVQKKVEDLLSSGEHGRILKEGIKIVICGRPNVGKSSLLNVLLKQPRAIVSDIAGTTRDTIEETAQIKGIPFQLVDTAGILEPRDLIEEEAVKRSQLNIKGADLVLLVLDASQPLHKEDQTLIKNISGRNILVVFNKSDLKSKLDDNEIQRMFPGRNIVKISALEKKGIGDLEQAVVDHVWHGDVAERPGLMVSNLRHIKALKDCQEALAKAVESVDQGISLEFVSEEIKRAVNFLDSITGRNIDEDLLDNIFSKFCIGK